MTYPFKQTFFITAIICALIVLTGAGCGGAVTEDESIEYEDVEELIEEIDQAYKIRGSCNAIARASQCVDYIGSFWTEEQMKLNCEGVGQFSTNTCPYSEVGGCQVGAGTLAENVMWSFSYGGEPIAGEQIIYASGACNAIPGAQWVTPEQIGQK